MTKSPKDMMQELKMYTPKMTAAMPEIMGGFSKHIKNVVMAESALSLKQKELMALGIAIYARCDYCIAYHVKCCLEAGATKEEIVETCGVAIQMGGGPSIAYSSFVFKCLDEFLDS